jgi:hypothetical protein
MDIDDDDLARFLVKILRLQQLNGGHVEGCVGASMW